VRFLYATWARVLVTVAAFIFAVFILGLLAMAYNSLSRPRGAIYGILSTLIIGGIPYLAWWITGRIGPPKEPPTNPKP